MTARQAQTTGIVMTNTGCCGDRHADGGSLPVRRPQPRQLLRRRIALTEPQATSTPGKESGRARHHDCNRPAVRQARRRRAPYRVRRTTATAVSVGYGL